MSHVLDDRVAGGVAGGGGVPGGSHLRLDIEGMRAIAVVAVLVFHAGLPWFAGGFVGVDVFFVLSGFLITGLLAREVSRTGRVRIGRFWARRVKRLLPASATVLVFSAWVSYVYLPITQRGSFGGDIVSAALYVVNWRLADRSVDYLAEDVGASPVQHYWSLSVEEQFYVIWPLLMLAVAVLASRRWRLGAFGALGLVTVTSFGYAVVQSHSSPETAFFVSTTRVWELGVGALLALSVTKVAAVPGVVRAVGGWVGLVAIACAVLFFDGSTTWPGTWTLVPVLGAALMIASGVVPTPGSPARLLSLRPMVWIGGLSYSLYLWHWPMLVAAQARYPDLRLRWTVLLMVAAVVPAWLCHRFIENPVRFGTAFKPTGRALVMGAVLTVVGVGAGLGLSVSANAGSVQEASGGTALGARALTDPADKGVVWSEVKSVEQMRPLAVEAPTDRPPVYDERPDCQVKAGDSKPVVCEFGDPGAGRTIVMVGDSKILQWKTALDTIAKKQGWKLIQISKSACPFTAAYRGVADSDNCHRWGEESMDKILQIKPDLVITSNRHRVALPIGQTTGEPTSQKGMADGLETYWRTMTDAGIPVVSLLDNPDPGQSAVYECVAENPKNLPLCAFDEKRGVGSSGAPAQVEAAKQVPAVKVVDMASTICPDGNNRCAAVIGNVLVYRQGSHLTRTYVDSAEPQLSAKLFKATGGAFGSR